jgi:hypothetical protein
LQQAAQHRSHTIIFKSAKRDQTMTFMIIWQKRFEFSAVRVENLRRLAIGRIVIIFYSLNMELRQLELRQEAQAGRDFLSHILGHPTVRQAIPDIPGIEETHEGIHYPFADGEYFVPEWALKTWADKIPNPISTLDKNGLKIAGGGK